MGPQECLIGVYMNFNYTQEQCSKLYFKISELDLHTTENFTFTKANETDTVDSVIPSCINYTWKGTVHTNVWVLLYISVYLCYTLALLDYLYLSTCE